MEKRGWITWFTWKANKIPRQGICITYIGHRRPPILPKERRHYGLPSQILEAQVKLVGLVSLHAPDGNSARRWEKERHEEISLSGNWSISLFFRSAFIHRDETQGSCGVSSPDFIKISCFIQMYTKILGVLHHLLAKGPVNNSWPSPCDSGQSTRTLISPGMIYS